MASFLTSFLFRLLITAAAVIAPLGAAHAYVGPGLGLGTVAVVLGVIGSVFLALFAIFWYPMKRMLKKKKASSGEAES